MGEPKCGNKTVWTVLTLISFIVGGVMVIAAIAQGSCSCEHSVPDCLTAYESCTEMFGGCDCAISTSYSVCCKSSGLTWGAFWAVLILGIIALIAGCVFTCGACACCCFKGAAAGAPSADEMNDVVKANVDEE